MIKLAIAIVLFAHGIGHTMGPLQTFKVTVVNPAWSGDSWLLTNVAGQTVTVAIGVVLWAVALVGFIAAAAVVMGWLPEGWWAPLAIAASIASLVAIALFPSAFPIFSTIGAAIVDIGVLVAVVWLRWTPSALVAG
jgi:hypothetical protein